MSETDLISRQAAIDELHGKDPSQIWDTADIEVWLNTLPSEQPEKVCVAEVKVDGEELRRCVDRAVERLKEEGQTERKTGKWLFPYGDKKYKRCSVCERDYYSIPHTSNFCPNCGADMRGGENG